MRICLLTDQDLDADPFDPDDWPCDPRPFMPDADWTVLTLEKSSAVAQIIEASRAGFDLFFNLCDGAWDEGRVGVEVVETLEWLDVPFTGATREFYEPSREAMKRVCHGWGIDTPAYVVARRDEDVERAARTLRYPLFVKHPSSYASNGLTEHSRVETPEALRERAGEMIHHYGAALIEEFIEGIECTVLVAEDPDDPFHPTTYQPIQYRFPEGESFKHYDLKWVNYGGLEAFPVEDPELDARLRRAAADFFVGMRGASYGRCDVRVDADGRPFMLEINPNCGIFYPPTDPGSADLCLLHDPAGHAGFTRQVVAAAFARHKRRRESWQVLSRQAGDYGLFATRAIAKGERIVAFEERAHHLVTRGHVESTWDEWRREWFRRYAWPLSDEVWVTWSEDPEDWRPVNHSCDPSAWLDGLDVVARRDIAAGEEITLEYATFYDENMPSFTCCCGAAACRGTIRGDDYLLPFVAAFDGHLSDHIRRKRAAAFV
ncbi:MAG: SET domain-containing protein-lysine N-methyltransferase [Gemmatimonadota bacterium]|jgi:D-alanine-D-alanine ligase